MATATQRAQFGRQFIQRAQGISSPKSLAELALSAEEYTELLTWASHLSGRQVRESLLWNFEKEKIGGEVWGSGDVTGFLLLLTISEIARREAQEGDLWSPIRQYFSETSREYLFTSKGQPTQLLKEGLESVAAKAQLRHVFGVAATQRWYLSIYLQFGFTRNGISRLPYWLSGLAVTESVGILLGRELPGQASKSFKQLWDLLSSVHRREVNPDEARRQLSHYPFVLPEWHEELITQAQKHIDWAPRQSGPVEESTEPLLFAKPSLRWPAGGTPQLVTICQSAAGVSLDARGYKILIDQTPVGYLSCDSNGVHEIQKEIPLPDWIGTHMMQLESDSYRQELELWSPDEDITVFEASSGARLDPYQDALSNERSYILAVAPDVEVMPAPSEYYILPHPLPKLYRLPPRWPKGLRVLLESQELWAPASRGHRPEPSWASTVRLEVNQMVNQIRRTAAVVGLPPGVQSCRVRIGLTWIDGNEVDLKPCAGKNTVSCSLLITLAGQLSIIRRSIDLPRDPVLERTPSGWVPLKKRTMLTTHEAKSMDLKVHASFTADKDLCLMEDTTFVKRAATRAERIGEISGFGGKLSIKNGRFNLPQEWACISASIEDHGVINSITRDRDSVVLDLQDSLDLGPTHRILIWSTDGTVDVIPPASILCDLRQWLIGDLTPEQTKGWIAIASRWERLGAIWPDDSTRLRQFRSGMPPHQVAGLLKWFHFPICAPDVFHSVQQMAWQHPAEFLSTWLVDDEVQISTGPKLVFPRGSVNGWNTAVRSIFWGWRNRDSNISRKVVVALKSRLDTSPALHTFVEVTNKVDPMLTIQLLQSWLRNHSAPSQIIERLLPRTEDIEVQGRECLPILQADSGFLDHLVERASHALFGGSIHERDDTNLRVALNYDAFRRYLFGKLLYKYHEMLR